MSKDVFMRLNLFICTSLFIVASLLILPGVNWLIFEISKTHRCLAGFLFFYVLGVLGEAFADVGRNNGRFSYCS